MLALLGFTLVGVPAANAVTEHCATTRDGYTGVKVEDGSSPATIQVRDTRTGNLVSVVVTITGTTFQLTPVDSSLKLTDASWCIKSSTNATYGTGTTGVSGSRNQKGVIQNISYVMVYSVTTGTPPPAECVKVEKNGTGNDSQTFTLGTTGPTSFWLVRWSNYGPGTLTVTYQGSTIFSGALAEANTQLVNVPAGSASSVQINVDAPSDSNWTYIAKCPGFDWNNPS